MSAADSFRERWRNHELELCRAFNRSCRREGTRAFFRIISRAGDGVFWYALMVCLPLLYGWEALWACLNMAISGVICLVIYKRLKSATNRQRPYAVSDAIHAGAPALDQYSFPSGHTLHAFSFAITATTHYPQLAWVTVPMTAAVSMSRLALGLHYPTDVLAGAAIGTMVASLLLPFFV